VTAVVGHSAVRRPGCRGGGTDVRQRAWYSYQQRLARSLAAHGALREGLSEATTTDIMWAIANPNTYYALVSERRWTPEAYEQWLAHMLTCALLPETRALSQPGERGG
jgi:hypothetical protein